MSETKKKSVKKESVQQEMFLQFDGRELSLAELEKRVKADFKAKHDGEELMTLSIYIKPVDNAGYYVANGNIEDVIPLFELPE